MFRNMTGQFFKSYGASVNLGFQQGILNLIITYITAALVA